MYINKVVTVSSTAIIATITATPLRMPGPSDTPIFSVVSPSTTPFSIEATAAVQPLSVATTALTTATATVTMTIANNGSPYLAFNASSYSHHNSTKHQVHHHENSTDKRPSIESNCTDMLPVAYRGGNQTFNITTHPSELGNPRTFNFYQGHIRKNETKHPHADGEGSYNFKNSTQLGHAKLPPSIAPGSTGIPYTGPNGVIHEYTPPADDTINETVADEGGNSKAQSSNSYTKDKRQVSPVWLLQLM